VAWSSVESRVASIAVGTPAPSSRRRPRRTWRWWLPLVATGIMVSACSLHVSKHGISGNVFGHKFSGASGQLPSGFPSNVPVPDNSRVLIGGGTDNDWDVSFAVTGTLSSGTTAYQSKFQSAGYTISNVETGSTTVTSNTALGQNTNVAGSVFTAKNSQWTVEVASGTTSSAKNGPLKAGEFAINITVVPVTSTSPPST
jgi:hypothetical protein